MLDGDAVATNTTNIVKSQKGKNGASWNASGAKKINNVNMLEFG